MGKESLLLVSFVLATPTASSRRRAGGPLVGDRPTAADESRRMNEQTRLPIALLLARLRAEARLSQADLAARVNGISRANLTRWDISRYERGGGFRPFTSPL